MIGNYLLDTNIIIHLFAGNEPIVEKIKDLTGIVLSSIVLGELFYGAFNSSKIEDNIRRIDTFTSRFPTILTCDSDTAKEYGKIKSELKKKGNPIPENDLWLAAITMQHNLILITQDKHFSFVDGLNVKLW